MQLHERIFELALTRSFFIPANEPYGSVSGFYDYGPVGVLIKQKIERLWRRMFIKSEGFLEVETSIITPEPVLVASGHVSSFADPVVECQNCKTRMRADSFVEEKHYALHGEKWDGKLESLDDVIKSKDLKCPKCNGEFGKTFMFNLMFKTGTGSDKQPSYCRPETAQGIFTAFPRLCRNHGAKLPLAIGQVGRSFRNEISPRKGLVRMREFTQMELEYFFDPSDDKFPKLAQLEDRKLRMKIEGKIREMTVRQITDEKITPNDIMTYFLARAWEFYGKVGVPGEKMAMRLLERNEVPHYSKCNIDLEVETSYGTIETIGNAYRTDFDLSSHMKQSGKEFGVFVEGSGQKIIPHVFEISMGVDRLFFCMLEHCFRERGGGKEWEWFDFPVVVAPFEAAVFPLMKKDGLAEKSEEIAALVRDAGLDVFHSGSGSIGKRYARADEIGIPYAITIDYETLEQGTVTIRYRNDGKQERINVSDIVSVIRQNMEKGRVTL